MKNAVSGMLKLMVNLNLGSHIIVWAFSIFWGYLFWSITWHIGNYIGERVSHGKD